MISLDAVATAIEAERRRAVEILELCSAAPERAATFIRDGTTPDQVRRALTTAAHQAPAPQVRASSFDPAWIAKQLRPPLPQ